LLFEPLDKTQRYFVFRLAVGSDPIPMGVDHLSKLLVRLQALPFELITPVIEEFPCPGFALVVPKLAERLAQAGCQPIPAADIIAWCRANLAQFKAPRCILFRPLPKTSTGKIQKFELRERAKEIAPEPHASALRALDAPDALERELQSICEWVLGISPEWSQICWNVAQTR
jgi:hypothetical protein